MDSLPRPIAFVLSGGASLGAVQVGMIRALDEARVAADLIVGTSVGAINGAMLAASPATAGDRLAAIWLGLNRSDVFGGTLWRQAATLLRTRTHLFAPTGLRLLLRNNLPQRFDELEMPLAVVATDAKNGHVEVFSSGGLEPALMASAAIPGLFPPVVIDGGTYIDGGVASNVPMAQALDAGASSLVVLDAGYPCHRDTAPHSITEALLFSSSVLLRHQATGDLPIVARRLPVVYLPSPCPLSTSPLDFSQAGQLMRAAYELVVMPQSRHPDG